MRISAAMLKDARRWRPQISEYRDGVIEIFPIGEHTADSMSRVLTLDAPQNHGTIKPGKITIAPTCKNAATPFDLTRQVIEQIRGEIGLGGTLISSMKKIKKF